MSKSAQPSSSNQADFVSDIKAIRERARQNIQRGAITDSYEADRETVLRLLNDALATEIVCVLRYRRHYYMAEGLHAEAVKAEFLEHAMEEQDHADKLALRIVQLNGKPDLNPATLTKRSHAEYVEGENLVEMIREDLVAERIAIDSYRGNDRLYPRQRFDDAPAARGHIGQRRRACRGFVVAARRVGGLSFQI